MSDYDLGILVGIVSVFIGIAIGLVILAIKERVKHD